MAHLYRSVAALRIFGDALDPDEISRLLGGIPTSSYRKGDRKRSRYRDVIRKSGAWILDATAREPENLDGQVEEILGQLTQDLTIWIKLGQEYAIDLFCGLFMEETDEGVNLSAKTLKALGDRGIKIGLCIYAPTEDPKPGDLCLCGSGKKYSECCALKQTSKTH